MGDEERIAYLAGESAAHLDPSERAELDELSLLLADAALWAEPDQQLQERIVLAVQAETGGAGAAGRQAAGRQADGRQADGRQAAGGSASVEPSGFAAETRLSRHRRPRQWRYALVAAAAAVLLGIGLIVVTGRNGSSAAPSSRPR